jgi:hypothetical protein
MQLSALVAVALMQHGQYDIETSLSQLTTVWLPFQTSNLPNMKNEGYISSSVLPGS